MGFKRIFWGFIFLFDLRFNNFDILPDFIGYILIVSGLGLLLDLNPRFEAARKFALPLIFLSLFDIYQVNIPLNYFSLQPATALIFVLGLISAVLNLLLVYNLCTGIAERAGELGKTELESTARSRWNMYLFMHICLWLAVFLAYIAPPVILAIIIFSLIVYGLMLGLMTMAERELSEPEQM